ncbi:MAG: tRNA pseudouridine(38-40) synthase TruA [Alphaproteobacteria bacterium]|jgi:tRNA pseudouridine38-40 synthase|nr:tRNA pseudouridine(38-40) synthase TruA [Alphaproteobacteria bacterium]
MKYRLNIEYCGTKYSGWQKQPDIQKVKTIQGELEKAISQFCNKEKDIEVYACGRTDAGVHAISMPAHIELKNTDITPEKFILAANALLKKEDISITSVEKVQDDFHARFNCKRRYYQYKILNRPAPSALNKDKAWWIPQELDIKAMQKAAKILIGKHDFSSFRAANCQAASPVKTLEYIKVSKSKYEKDVITIDLYAPSFIYHQVRNISGTLADVGKGKTSIKEFKKIFKACDRTKAGITAPAEGLYFVKADY